MCKVVYDYNEPPEQPELGKLIVPLNYVHFGDTPPALGSQAQLFPKSWRPQQNSEQPPAILQSASRQQSLEAPAAVKRQDVHHGHQYSQAQREPKAPISHGCDVVQSPTGTLFCLPSLIQEH